MTSEMQLIIKTHFSGWRPASVSKLANQILAVDKGWRTGYLWDIPEQIPTVKEIKNLLVKLQGNGELQQEMKLLSLEMELFLVNSTGVLEAIDQPERFLFLDINTCQIVDRREDIASLRSQIEDNVELLDFSSDPTTCLASISGVLIDYPVVYYYDPRGEVKSGGESLIVYSVAKESTPLYSFSIPAPAVDKWETIKTHMDKWEKRLRKVGLTVDTRLTAVNSWIL